MMELDGEGHNPRFQCQNCDYATDSEDELDDIEDAADRVTSDDLMGSGQCPECGALVFDTCGKNYKAIHSSRSNDAAAEKIADRLLQITGINAQAALIYPATGEVQSSNLAGPYNRDDLIQLISGELD